ncbi:MULTISPECIES: hypothetical protein [Streptomyces]|uniref:Uncharacterized protein n=2 Tax=Streptomyces TaxID=1883 RepID=A0A2N8PBP0_STRNR|nr:MULTISPECIES: hypothetical protein [Streptomyces]PNE38425.1 hypothetical protein AOB60_30790 [Streptomyces noursei]SHN22582.1 hypothetical protein SAMN05216268_12562 [Streptomyces yunnanensis]
MAEQREPDAPRKRGRREGRARDDEREPERSGQAAPEAEESTPESGTGTRRVTDKHGLFPTFSHRDD